MANPLLPAGAVPLAASLIDTDTVMVEVGGILRRVRRDAFKAFLDVAEAGEPVNGASDGTLSQPGIAFAGDGGGTGLRRPAAHTMEAVANGAPLWRASPAALTVSVPINGSAVQQSPSDATAGRLLAVGAFGLGGTAVLMDNAALPNRPSGLYAYLASSGSNGGPPGATRGALLHVREPGANRDSQMMVVAEGTGFAAPNTVWTRVRDAGGVWSAWASDSPHSEGGTPNGQWRRWADGRQQCSITLELGSRTTNGTGTYSDPWRTAPRDWTFPQPFATTPAYVSLSPRVAAAADALRGVTATFRAATETGVTGILAVAVSGDTQGVAVTMHTVAEGRWA